MIDINDDNFDKYFTDVRKGKRPEKGQIMARWSASADFVPGWIKENVISLLTKTKGGGASAQKVLKNVVGAIERDSIRVCVEMSQDLLDGMTIDEVYDKPYRFVVEMFYWVKPEYVPDDPHWSKISILDTTQGITEKELLTS